MRREVEELQGGAGGRERDGDSGREGGGEEGGLSDVERRT